MLYEVYKTGRGIYASKFAFNPNRYVDKWQKKM